MRLLLALLILVVSIIHALQLNGQNERDVQAFNKLTLNEKQEILINKLRGGANKYAKADIFHNALGSQNINPYSELYIINGKQYFRFDIVNQACVEEFIDQYLVKSKVKAISKVSLEFSQAIYGTLGKQGVTTIEIKHLKKVQTKNCGFKVSKNNRGDNLDQWKKGDIKIN